MRLAKNSFYSLMGMVVPLLVSLVTVPLLVGEIGAARFGALAIVWILLGYFGVADFGIGRAITQRIASRPDEPPNERARAAWSALALIAGIGIIAGVAAFLSAHLYFGEAFQTTGTIEAEMIAASWLLLPCVMVAAISGVPTGVLIGLGRIKEMAFGTALGQAAMQVLPLLVAMLHSASMGDLVLAVLAGRSLGLIMLMVSLWRASLRNQPVSFAQSEMGGLLRFGVWIMLGALVGPLMVVSDRFVIGALVGAVAVAAYTIPFQVAYRTLALPQALTQAAYQRLAGSDPEESRRQCRDYTLFAGQTFAPAAIVLIILAGPLLELWLGSKLDPRSVPVAQIVMAGVWANAVAQLPAAYIQARGNSRFTGLLTLIELPAYIALLALLGSRYGLPGFAAAFAIRCVADTVILLGKAQLGVAKVARGLFVPALLVMIALLLSQGAFQLPMQIGLAVVLGGIAALAALLAMPQQLRANLPLPRY